MTDFDKYDAHAIDVDVSDIIGKVITHYNLIEDDQLHFHCKDGTKYVMYHNQDCCERVTLEDVAGDLKDLIAAPIIHAEMVTNSDTPKSDDGWTPESFTWTFYKFSTIVGSVTLRWYGTSNGYYSERVDFCKVLPETPGT